MSLVCDTGPLLAALDAGDPDHAACARILTEASEDLVIPVLVLAELDYWCGRRLGSRAWLLFLEDVKEGIYSIADLDGESLARCGELQRAYDDLRLGVVDASVIALVERLNEPKVATLDQRHFRMVRPKHVSALDLVP